MFVRFFILISEYFPYILKRVDKSNIILLFLDSLTLVIFFID